MICVVPIGKHLTNHFLGRENLPHHAVTRTIVSRDSWQTQITVEHKSCITETLNKEENDSVSKQFIYVPLLAATKGSHVEAPEGDEMAAGGACTFGTSQGRDMMFFKSHELPFHYNKHCAITHTDVKQQPGSPVK